MSECFLHGMRGGGSAASGTGLNILYGGERPITAEPDTIWVSTDAASGDYVLSHSAPEGEEGLVWFQTGDKGLSVTMQSPVKAVFLLINAFVYLNGEWTFMAEAGIYKDGAWSLFCESCMKLYDAGDLCTDNTGGFNQDTYLDILNMHAPEYRDDCAYFESQTDSLPSMCTNKRIVLDKYSKLVVDWYVEQGCPQFPDVTFTLTVLSTDKKQKMAEINYGVADIRRTDVLDVKDLKGEFYIVVRSRVYCARESDAVTMKGYLYSLELQV